MLWMFVIPAVAPALRRGEESTDARPAARFVLGWSGMRGGVSLALALAIPLTITDGAMFPGRSQVVFLAYVVVLLTLVPAGFTLGPLIKRLGLNQGAERRRQLAEAHARVLHAALEEIEALAGDGRVDEENAQRLRAIYEAQLERVRSQLRDEQRQPDRGDEHVSVRRAVLAAERRRLAELHAEHSYPSGVLREIAHELDLEESRQR
jgi:CPA1 family monovalent cation:H+ antiporter